MPHPINEVDLIGIVISQVKFELNNLGTSMNFQTSNSVTFLNRKRFIKLIK